MSQYDLVVGFNILMEQMSMHGNNNHNLKGNVMSQLLLDYCLVVDKDACTNVDLLQYWILTKRHASHITSLVNVGCLLECERKR